MRAYICEAWESSDRKTRQYLGLFLFLAVIYTIYLGIQLRVFHAASDQFAGFCIVSALPFALLAFADSEWSSNDAAPVSLAAWVAVSVAFSFKCTICVFALAAAFFPFILSALLAHGLGALGRFLKDRIRDHVAA